MVDERSSGSRISRQRRRMDSTFLDRRARLSGRSAGFMDLLKYVGITLNARRESLHTSSGHEYERQF